MYFAKFAIYLELLYPISLPSRPEISYEIRSNDLVVVQGAGAKVAFWLKKGATRGFQAVNSKNCPSILGF